MLLAFYSVVKYHLFEISIYRYIVALTCIDEWGNCLKITFIYFAISARNSQTHKPAMGDYDSDDEKSQVEKLRYAKVPRGMFVSGWDDDADELIEEDKNPQGTKANQIQCAFHE